MGVTGTRRWVRVLATRMLLKAVTGHLIHRTWRVQRLCKVRLALECAGVVVLDCEVRGSVRQHKTAVHPEGMRDHSRWPSAASPPVMGPSHQSIPEGWERGISPERSRIPSGMPVAIAPCPVVSRPLNHRLVSLTPSGVNEQALRNSVETEIPSYTRVCPPLSFLLHRPDVPCRV
jgi:hypothetical protein